MALSLREVAKEILSYAPFGPQLTWLVRGRRGNFGRYNLERLRAALPDIQAQAAVFARNAFPGKRVFLFASIYYWVEHCTVLGLALAGQGQHVTLGYFPYADYRKRTTRLDRRYYSYYTRLTLKPAQKLLRTVNLFDIRPASFLPPTLQQAVETISLYDTQYVLQVEDVDLGSDFYRMRLEYNEYAARTLFAWLRTEKPGVLLFPNGIVIEYGIAYQIARYLNVPVVTYEYTEDREQIWIAHDDEVMRQNTDVLWKACGNIPLIPHQRKRIEALEQARQSARTFGKSNRLWQDVPPQGQESIRTTLGLDRRPVALLATNVLGDSLILGRNIFSRSMGEWITRTIKYFAQQINVQLIVRIHPGERFMTGPAILNTINKNYPQLPENVHVVGPLDKINTYDIMTLACLGLVYTTTNGMEMVMNGLPVVVAANTHYRRHGFTIDPQTWDEYFQAIERVLTQPKKHCPTPQQVELAWNYAYRFFFEYPRPFPWGIVEFWRDYETWPINQVLGKEGQSRFGASFRCLVGEPIDWTDWE